VHDDQGNILPSAKVTAGLLLGDVNGDGVVDATDADQTALDQGETTDADNFREDINSNGSIDAADLAARRIPMGPMLPPLAMPSIFVIDESDNSVLSRQTWMGPDATDLGNIVAPQQPGRYRGQTRPPASCTLANESGNSVTMSNLDGSSPVNLTLGGLLQIRLALRSIRPAGKSNIAVQSALTWSVRANLDGYRRGGPRRFRWFGYGLFASRHDIDTRMGRSMSLSIAALRVKWGESSKRT
jgi:hypothetical protein